MAGFPGAYLTPPPRANVFSVLPCGRTASRMGLQILCGEHSLARGGLHKS